MENMNWKQVLVVYGVGLVASATLMAGKSLLLDPMLEKRAAAAAKKKNQPSQG